MIQVEPPGQISVQPQGQSNVDSAAVTKEAIAPDVGPLVPNAFPSAEDDPLGATAAGSAAPSDGEWPNNEWPNNDWSDGEFRLAPLDETPAAIPAEAARELDNPSQYGEPWQTESPPLNPSEEWTSPRSAQSRQLLMVGFVGLAGIIVAGVLFVLFLRWVNSDQQVAANPPPANTAIEASTGEEQEATTIGQASELPADNDPAGNEPGSESGSETASELGDQQDSNLDSGNLLGGGRLGNDIASPTEDSSIPAVAPNGSPNGSGALGNPTERSSADGGGGISELPPSLGGGPTPEENENNSLDESDQEDDNSLPKQLAAFEQLLNYQVIPVLPDTEVLPSEAPLTAEELGLVGDATATGPQLDLAELGKAELSPLIIRNRPLASVINFWNHLSGIPTVINLDALAAAGINRNQGISLQQIAPQTAKALGQSLAAAAGCRLVEGELPFWSIQPTIEQVQQVVPTEVSLAGLVGEADQAWFSSMLVELLPQMDAQTAWQGDKLVFANSAEADEGQWLAWFYVVRLIANWQLASTGSISLDSDKLDEQVLHHPLVDPTQITALDKRLNFVTMEAVPSGQLLSRCADEVGLQCWIDWANVGASGLQPNSRLAVVTMNREFRRVLADYASQYSLVVALLDEKNLWLTTPIRYRSEARLYVVPSGGRTPEQWQQQLRLLTPIDAGGNSLLRIIASPDQQWMFLRCCPPSLRE